MPVQRARGGRGAIRCIAALALMIDARNAGSQVAAATAATGQNPSPMIEATRAHERLGPKELGGTTRSFTGPAGKPAELWIPDDVKARDAFDLVVHFHGAAWLPEQAVAAQRNTVAAVLNLGVGSGAYDARSPIPRCSTRCSPV